jgi:hypothetical protein
MADKIWWRAAVGMNRGRMTRAKRSPIRLLDGEAYADLLRLSEKSLLADFLCFLEKAYLHNSLYYKGLQNHSIKPIRKKSENLTFPTVSLCDAFAFL